MARIGTVLLARREELGMRQEDVAWETGFSQEYVSKVETGKTKRPGPERLRTFARVLKMDYDELMLLAGHLPDTVQRNPRVLVVANNSDILTDDDWREIDELIERRRQARGLEASNE